MLPDEILQYNNKSSEYKKIIKDCKIFYPLKLKKLIILSTNNSKLRKALLLRNEMIEITLIVKQKF